jgi:DNA-binding response OmpR family regulator
LKPFFLAYATTQAAWAVRLGGVASAQGWRLLSAASPGGLLLLLAEDQAGLIVADWEALDTAPGLARRWVAKAHKNAPGFALILAGGPACFGAALSRVLSAGADDAVERSLPEKDLAKRLLIHARRCSPQPRVLLEAPGGEVRVDRVQSKLFLKERGRWKSAGPLSAKELSLLWCFLENPGMVLARSALLDLLRPGRAHDVNAEAVDKHVEALRRKLGRRGRLIVTVYGAGYRLETSPVSASRGGGR